MNEVQFKIEIKASRECVWRILWEDETFREWAGLIDPGTFMAGGLIEGNTVQFISAGGYGVTSLVAKLIPNKYVLFKHQADTQDEGSNVREDQWTGGDEGYTLTYQDGVTALVISFQVPVELEKIMRERYPKALQRVKEFSEKVRA